MKHKGRPPGERGPSGWIRTLGTACRAGHDLFDTVVARTQDVAPSPCRNSADGLERVGHSPQGAGHRVAHSGARGLGPINVRPRGALSARLLPPITLSFLDDLVRNDGNHRQPLLSGPGRLIRGAVLLPSNLLFENYRTVRRMSTPSAYHERNHLLARSAQSTTVERVFYRFRTLNWVRFFPCGS